MVKRSRAQSASVPAEVSGSANPVAGPSAAQILNTSLSGDGEYDICLPLAVSVLELAKATVEFLAVGLENALLRGRSSRRQIAMLRMLGILTAVAGE